MSRKTFQLVHDTARKRAMAEVASAPAGYVITVAPATRNGEQNALLHVLLSEIARQVQWAGQRRDIDTWKRLLTAAWLRARGESVEILPALDGHGVDVVFRRTSSLNKGECAELIDFIGSWAAQQGIELEQSAAA
jgi:hypothetical protein